MALNYPHSSARAADLDRPVLAFYGSWERNRHQYPSDALVTWYKVETVGLVCHPAMCSQADNLQMTEFHTGGSTTASSYGQWIICDYTGS